MGLMEAQPDLPEVVNANQPILAFPDRLNGGQQ